MIDGIGAALDEAERDLGISSGLILSFLRDQPVDDAERTLTAGLCAHRPHHRRRPRLGRGRPSAVAVRSRLRARPGRRASTSSRTPARRVRPNTSGRPSTCCGVERIDHGIRAIEDPELVARLAAEGIALTMCPLSNVRLRTIDTLASIRCAGSMPQACASRSTPTTPPTSAATSATTSWRCATRSASPRTRHGASRARRSRRHSRPMRRKRDAAGRDRRLGGLSGRAAPVRRLTPRRCPRSRVPDARG